MTHVEMWIDKDGVRVDFEDIKLGDALAVTEAIRLVQGIQNSLVPQISPEVLAQTREFLKMMPKSNGPISVPIPPGNLRVGNPVSAAYIRAYEEQRAITPCGQCPIPMQPDKAFHPNWQKEHVVRNEYPPVMKDAAGRPVDFDPVDEDEMNEKPTVDAYGSRPDDEYDERIP